MSSLQTFTAAHGKDGSIMVIDHSENFSGESVTVYLFLRGVLEHSMVAYLEIIPDLDSERNALSISIVDVVGGSRGGSNCNKGFGSQLMNVAFAFIKGVYSFQPLESISVSGKMSDVGDHDEDDHLRRVHYWKKMGMTIKDESDHLSLIKSTLEKCNSTTIEPIKLEATGLVEAFIQAKELAACHSFDFEHSA
ncbi:hypothetical protein [Vibrio crassostreae]|uniref:hypothetical protein n=1 Tax=Vibrio crassostreae TaxID=246167 RepID=UPI001B30272B|nr:hypothetical protein [Vibrio crassostreae]